MFATRAYCLSKRKATEDSPDGWNATCMRLNNKIFAILNHEEGEKAAITLKCDPELAIRIRDDYPDTIIPGYHMNKKHWNTVYIHKDVEQVQINKMIDWSYNLVLQSFSKKKQQELLD
ncbi:cytoplasmic protein [Bacillus cereus]|uniref:Cytoplasmic protein n=1 Tax=Bacillus cereus TaxID=1396 RepID=A0A2B0LFA7_BACCE|nr:MmcQ/YjbR family DNA-binding protein [Bacillus cereus]PEC82281.1 cytoplasmic protein [Bacillus cereus]PEQ47626.1 cytoplasmic protein [Bacillus cereus]PEX36757.1 cytoplasmic protein [Bacillus cereus]PFB10749.1 cytoplasmic protein [Bacillus cereus]PFC69682.1 cytoplasmic protein [Bacillus cereus]